MKYKTNYKGNEIMIQQSETEDWREKDGYEARITPRGCKTATSWNNYDNAMQALNFAKESIDKEEVPHERKRFLGLL